MKFKYLIAAIAALPFLPFLYRDGKRVLAAVPRLPDANGPQGVEARPGPPLKLLLLGESTMAGVGVATHAEGFAGSLARTLADGWQRTIDWRVHARSGYTLKRLRAEVLPLIEEHEWDLIVVAMGANEAFKMNTPAGVRRDWRALITTLRERFGAEVPIAFTNMPPIREFPAFTPLLQRTLGKMVEYFGEELAEIVAVTPNTYYNGEVMSLADWSERLGMPGDPAPFFSDGVHPSALTYAAWGEDFGAFLLRQSLSV